MDRYADLNPSCIMPKLPFFPLCPSTARRKGTSLESIYTQIEEGSTVNVVVNLDVVINISKRYSNMCRILKSSKNYYYVGVRNDVIIVVSILRFVLNRKENDSYLYNESHSQVNRRIQKRILHFDTRLIKLYSSRLD